jgi:hypothetical protein
MFTLRRTRYYHANDEFDAVIRSTLHNRVAWFDFLPCADFLSIFSLAPYKATLAKISADFLSIFSLAPYIKATLKLRLPVTLTDNL